MSATGNDWQLERAAEAMPAAHAALPLTGKLTVVRDTLIVFSMQLVFRVTMILRHLNY